MRNNFKDQIIIFKNFKKFQDIKRFQKDFKKFQMISEDFYIFFKILNYFRKF